VAHNQALATLFREHSAAIAATIYRRTGSRDLAADLTQDTFVRYSSVAEQMRVENPRAFLFRIAKNLLVDYFRRAAVHRDDVTIEQLPAEAASQSAPSVEQEVLAHQEYAQFAAVVRSMPRVCRQVFILRKINDLSYAEIGAQLGMSEAAVEKHVVRGLKYCREKLQRERS
jgi:RNA polymerase sigma-70 factor (ECF subfamily)